MSNRLEIGSQAREIACKLRLGHFQFGEVAHGMDVDSDDGHAEWGRLVRTGGDWRKPTGYVEIYADQIGAAFYRLTSSRDIFEDNAADWPYDGLPQQAASMRRLVDRFVKAVGGLDAIPEDARRWY